MDILIWASSDVARILRRGLLVFLATIILFFAVALIIFGATSTMESHCQQQADEGGAVISGQTEWTWVPPGLSCSYAVNGIGWKTTVLPWQW